MREILDIGIWNFGKTPLSFGHLPVCFGLAQQPGRTLGINFADSFGN